MNIISQREHQLSKTDSASAGTVDLTHEDAECLWHEAVSLDVLLHKWSRTAIDEGIQPLSPAASPIVP